MLSMGMRDSRGLRYNNTGGQPTKIEQRLVEIPELIYPGSTKLGYKKYRIPPTLNPDRKAGLL